MFSQRFNKIVQSSLGQKVSALTLAILKKVPIHSSKEFLLASALAGVLPSYISDIYFRKHTPFVADFHQNASYSTLLRHLKSDTVKTIKVSDSAAIAETKDGKILATEIPLDGRLMDFVDPDKVDLIVSDPYATVKKDLENYTASLLSGLIVGGLIFWAAKKANLKELQNIHPVKERHVAYHEAGHALVALHRGFTSGIEEISIIPGGNFLGFVSFSDKLPAYQHATQTHYTSDLCMTFGGRAAEEIILNGVEFSSGVSRDTAQATEIARQMVLEFGMSDKVGPVSYYSDYSTLADETKREIDLEVSRILKDALNEARKILKENHEQLDVLAHALIERKKITRTEMFEVLNISPLHL